MTHWKLTLSYNGSSFRGWQVQPSLPTVQGTLAECLRRLTGETVLPQGAGRTDAGVHAHGQVASFTLHAAIPPNNLQRALNRLLPPEIRVLSAERVSAEFHARHSSRRKTYEYLIFERGRHGPAAERVCSPFRAPFVWDCHWLLNAEALSAAAAILPGERDFSAMAAAGKPLRGSEDYPGESPSSSPNPVKTIYISEWSRRDDLLVYRVCGSGFLHHMVRNLVGTMVEIGRGSLQPEDLRRILDGRDRSQAGPTAPANGLFLLEVIYADTPETAHLDREQDTPAWSEAWL